MVRTRFAATRLCPSSTESEGDGAACNQARGRDSDGHDVEMRDDEANMDEEGSPAANGGSRSQRDDGVVKGSSDDKEDEQQTQNPQTEVNDDEDHHPARRVEYLTEREPSSIPIDVPESYKKPCPKQCNNLFLAHSCLFKSLKSHIANLPLSNIVASAEAIASRSRTEVLCEYTWIGVTPSQEKTGQKFPAVYVPGNTRTWHGIDKGMSLHDGAQGHITRDEHLARQPAFPYEPTLRALADTQRKKLTNFQTVDICSDSTTLSQLFAFISGSRLKPFRLELSTVHNTLFLVPKQHRGLGHTVTKSLPGFVNDMVPGVIPNWAADAANRLGTYEPDLPYSGGHYRVVRYRLGGLVCVVRGKVDFIYKGRGVPSRVQFDPLGGLRPKVIPTMDAEGKNAEGTIGTLVTTVQRYRVGPKAGSPGVTCVRFASRPEEMKLAEKMPELWFGRVPAMVDAAVSDCLEVEDATLHIASDSYKVWEEEHQSSLKVMAGFLRKLKQVTHDAGGHCVLVGDPLGRCSLMHEPVLKKRPVPEELVVKFWRQDDDPAVTEYASTVASDASELAGLSDTPSDFSDWHIAQKKPAQGQRKRRRMDDPDSRGRVALKKRKGEAHGQHENLAHGGNGLDSSKRLEKPADEEDEDREDEYDECEEVDEEEVDEEEARGFDPDSSTESGSSGSVHEATDADLD